ncbi:ABC-type transport system permease protein [Halobiforma haloterrestris]|uniref:ABC-type transport system permease protein n=1 Tax=Natronobacterium haloterrestre TaxID=148448 RepID=A0A1I1GBF5_NATHA|nr:PrsW family intramembrane metalloprotease [Halobiforma haloterrestris]SFC06500.1 ABC-type transport system permease protein [Halobiforma haloterrestris]
MSEDHRPGEGDRGDRPGALGRRARGVLESASRTARVARWEVSRTTGTVDRKTLFVLAVVAIAVATVGLSVADEGLGLEDEIYVVGVDEDDPYYDVAAASDQFRTVPLHEDGLDGVYGADDPNVDVVIEDGQIGYVGGNGEAAYDAFRDAIDRYNEGLMAQEEDEAAAYPVLVEIDYQDRSFEGAIEPSSDGDSDTADGDDTPDDPDGGSDDGEAADTQEEDGDGTEAGADGDGTENDSPGATDSSGDGDGDERESESSDAGSDSDGDATGLEETPSVADSSDGAVSVPGSPSTLSPPFPFRSLVLAFLFVVPMNFVIQAYGSTIMDERINRRGELLLVSPASSREIVAGKTVPYLGALVAIVVAITVAIDGGPLSVAATLPVALLFLAATFSGAMFARSFKELTFVTVAISVGLTTYAFIPAIFTDVTPIALISPLTLVVMDLQGETPTLGAYLVSTGPAYLTAAVLFLLGIGTYREEDMFAQKPVPSKVVDAIAVRVRGKRSVPVLSVVFLPFVFAAQLLAVALLFAAPPFAAVPIILVVAAVLEEVAKSIHVYAGFSRARFEPTLGVAAVLGTLSGGAFFVAEKATQIVQLVGLQEFEGAVAAFGPETAAPAVADGPFVFAGIVLAPLVLHVVTAVVSVAGATRGRTSYAVALAVATAVHVGYNLGVILLVA